MTFALILASLSLGLPARCYETPAAWQARQLELNLPAWKTAYYQAGPDAHIAFSPQACQQVRRATLYGGWILGHELAHRWQDVFGRPFDEGEADRIASAAADVWRRRLARLFGVPPVVRLAP